MGRGGGVASVLLGTYLPGIVLGISLQQAVMALLHRLRTLKFENKLSDLSKITQLKRSQD